MPSGRPRDSTGGLRVRDVFLFSLLFTAVTASLQHEPLYNPPGKYTDENLSNPAGVRVEKRWTGSSPDSIHPPESHHHDSDSNSRVRHDNSPNVNQRALATVSHRAGSKPAGRDPPAQKAPVTTGGLNTRLGARSLQDWQVEDIMLLATVDGMLHARDRRDGSERWSLESEEMVQTVHHQRNKTADENDVELEDPMFIVEPSQDGAIYVLNPGYGLQRLDYTVKQLAELAPYASDGYPAVAYTARKETTLYTVDAATGRILKSFSSSGSIVNEESCRRVNPLQPQDEEECESIGTLTLGRNEYTIGIQDRNTGEPINTVKYFEWVSNNHDHDLRNKYVETFDHRYVYSKSNGAVFGLEITPKNDGRYASSHKPAFWQKFSSPVVRVFDVIRPLDDDSSDAPLVILPQPVGPHPNEWASLEDDMLESVFVGCTEKGNWYALSEHKYPAVTEGATTAKCYKDDVMASISARRLSTTVQREQLTGVHHLSQPRQHGPPLIDPGHHLTIEPPPEQETVYDSPELSVIVPEKVGHYFYLQFVVVVIVTVLSCGFLFKQVAMRPAESRTVPEVLPPVAVEITAPTSTIEPASAAAPLTIENEPPQYVREAEPAKETIIPHEHAATPRKVHFEEQNEDASESCNGDEDAGEGGELAETREPSEAGDTGDNQTDEAGEPKKKKKATRGKRGGRKVKQQAAQAELKARKGKEVPHAREVISIAASESREVAGSLQINSLVVHTDRILGQGSGGTMVFEGRFEDRQVAVKRMLSQYYQLALQEISTLQQTDDHENVVRYYCQQKDDHFLYIAVELCQASLLEVWEADKAKTEERRSQLQSLKVAIQQDMTRTLQQLAAGLCHLHALRIIHRDIKPQNILVGFPKRTQPAGTTRLVISDFGLGKTLPDDMSTINDATANAGTFGWKAPELITQPRDTPSNNSQSGGYNDSSGNGAASGASVGVKRAADIFSLGCLFFWVLTDGTHPYEDPDGWRQMREYNIKRGKRNLLPLSQWSDAYEPMQLITWMLEPQPEMRPTAQDVLHHPYFWSHDKRLSFLCDMSDHFEREARGVPDDGYKGDSYHLKLLEQRVDDVVGPSPCDFLSRLDKSFVDTLGKQRKYSGRRLLDLLRALRNKKNHYRDMPDDIQIKVGSLASGGYLNYWCNRFPRLLMACYDVVHKARLERSDDFKGYFAL